MEPLEQMKLIMEAIEQSVQDGKPLTIEQAQRKLHREHITQQLWNKHGLKPRGFLVLSGFTNGSDGGFLSFDPKIDTIFNSFLNMANKLTGSTGAQIRSAMDALGINYKNSPTYPLDNLEENAA